MPATYHHGDLRAQVLRSAAELIAQSGPEGVSLRELARRAGVSHAAPAHHFGDLRGLFTALATEGLALLADALTPSIANAAFDRTAVAYVEFAISHPGHFAVMFRRDLVDDDDDALRARRERTDALLSRGVDSIEQDRLVIPRPQAAAAAWSLVHGLASLWLAGALPGADPEALAHACARQLFTPPV